MAKLLFSIVLLISSSVSAVPWMPWENNSVNPSANAWMPWKNNANTWMPWNANPNSNVNANSLYSGSKHGGANIAPLNSGLNFSPMDSMTNWGPMNTADKWVNNTGFSLNFNTKNNTKSAGYARAKGKYAGELQNRLSGQNKNYATGGANQYYKGQVDGYGQTRGQGRFEDYGRQGYLGYAPIRGNDFPAFND